MKADVIGLLQEMRFSEYEAKAYLALLDDSPATGYAVALRSGVPRSKIYAVLGALVKRGDIVVGGEKQPVYTPLNPMELIARRKRNANQVFDAAETSLKRYIETGPTSEGIWNITGREAILARVREALGRAKQRVLLEMWKEEAEDLRADLAALAKKKTLIQIVAYGDIGFDFAEVRRHDLSEKITAEYEGRWLVLSVDDSEVVAGIVSQGDESRAAWSCHPGLVMPITEVVIHDLYIMEMLDSFRPQLEKKFGKNLIKLRRKFSIAPNGIKNYLHSPADGSGVRSVPKQ